MPANAGNIVRTCKVTGNSLTLVQPLGFSTSDRMLKRAGLDYWMGVDVQYTDNLHEHIQKKEKRPLFFSTKGKKLYTDVDYRPDDLLVFGSETDGLPQFYHETYAENFYTIPMQGDVRSLNLSNSVAIVIYEAWRQQGFNSFCTNKVRQ